MHQNKPKLLTRNQMTFRSSKYTIDDTGCIIKIVDAKRQLAEHPAIFLDMNKARKRLKWLNDATKDIR